MDLVAFRLELKRLGLCDVLPCQRFFVEFRQLLAVFIVNFLRLHVVQADGTDAFAADGEAVHRAFLFRQAGDLAVL